jgi:DNA-directed RNA polymerase specialized sigma24 family protein
MELNDLLMEISKICLIEQERMKHKEIAQALSITEGTVEQQMNIAIRKMLDAVSRYYNVVKRRIHLLF